MPIRAYHILDERLRNIYLTLKCCICSWSFVCFSSSLIIEGTGYDGFVIAWSYPGLGEWEVIPAIYSRTKKPVPCGVDLDCDDGIWCNGMIRLI